MNGSKNAAVKPSNPILNNRLFLIFHRLRPSAPSRAYLYIFLLLPVVFCFFSCSLFKKEPPPVRPYENLLTILADCQRHLKKDVYRFPYPKDIYGQNVYKSTLVRLANYEKLYPDRFTEILAFTRARLYERLGDYTQASHYYRVVASMKEELYELAAERLPICENFEMICGFSLRADTIEEYITEYETKLEALDILIEKCSGLDTEPLARLEKESTQVNYAVFLQDNRHLLKNGTSRALELWRSIIDQHSESKNIQCHKLHLADFYFSLAKEYVTWKPPERIGFDTGIFESYVLPARNIYYRVSREDGYREKLEAKGKLEAILSFMDTVRQRNR